MKKVLLLILCILICSIFINSCITSSKSAINDYSQTNVWKSSTPEEQGMDSRLLADAVNYLQEQNIKVHSLTVIRNGYVITDAYYYPYSKDSLHDIASASKSITSIMTGIAIDKGIIKREDQK